MVKVLDAIRKINPNAEVSIGGNSVDNIQWLNGTTPISKEDIKAQFPAVEFDNAMENLRHKRNDKLAETDFHGMSDRTMSADMTTYRQELRDLTNGLTTVEDVEAVVFPTKP